ncbi:MAG TPA: hypothetical protein VKU41_24485 [Polyangiaceae bacterium]|nr:hypothetical protein [Polyangiaceae bacterium]
MALYWVALMAYAMSMTDGMDVSLRAIVENGEVGMLRVASKDPSREVLKS